MVAAASGANDAPPPALDFTIDPTYELAKFLNQSSSRLVDCPELCLRPLHGRQRVTAGAEAAGAAAGGGGGGGGRSRIDGHLSLWASELSQCTGIGMSL